MGLPARKLIQLMIEHDPASPEFRRGVQESIDPQNLGPQNLGPRLASAQTGAGDLRWMTSGSGGMCSSSRNCPGDDFCNRRYPYRSGWVDLGSFHCLASPAENSDALCIRPLVACHLFARRVSPATRHGLGRSSSGADGRACVCQAADPFRSARSRQPHSNHRCSS